MRLLLLTLLAAISYAQTDDAYSHYRLVVTQNGGQFIWCLEELSFFDIYGKRLLVDKTRGSAQTEYRTPGNLIAENAFNEISDNDDWRKGAYCSGPHQRTGWLAYEFESPVTLSKYGLERRNGDHVGDYPVAWTFEGSNDGTSWEALDTQSGVNSWIRNERKEFELRAPIATGPEGPAGPAGPAVDTYIAKSGSNQKCENTGNNEHRVDSREACEAEAIENSADYYSYVGRGRKCFYSTTCSNVVSSRRWKIYERDQNAQTAPASGESCNTEFAGETTFDEHSFTFSFTAEHDDYVLDTCGTDWDTMLHILDSNGNTLHFNDDHNSDCTIGDNQYASHLEAQLTPGEEYTLKIDGYCATCYGPFTINVGCPGYTPPPPPEPETPGGEYNVHPGHFCSGKNINTWADGSPANFGTMSGIENCKAECDKHLECNAFIFKTADNKCGYWKDAPLNIWKWNDAHTCYEKALACKGWHCSSTTTEVKSKMEKAAAAFQVVGITENVITMLAFIGAISMLYYGLNAVHKMVFATSEFQEINDNETEC